MKPKPKTQAEIQRAHDILHFLGTPEAPAVFDGTARKVAHGVHDALAWALGFECGETFQSNLDFISDELRRKGFEQIDVGQPISADEARKRGFSA